MVPRCARRRPVCRSSISRCVALFGTGPQDYQSSGRQSRPLEFGSALHPTRRKRLGYRGWRAVDFFSFPSATTPGCRALRRRTSRLWRHRRCYQNDNLSTLPCCARSARNAIRRKVHRNGAPASTRTSIPFTDKKRHKHIISISSSFHTQARHIPTGGSLVAVECNWLVIGVEPRMRSGSASQ